MSGLFDQVVNYSPPLLTSGQVNYDGTWNAATNTPTLVNPPDALSKGDYYVVSAAGTQFSISFAVGDWIISNGTAWEKVDLTDAVSSVFGRTGAVVGDSTDYSAVGLTNTAIGAANPSTGAFTSLSSSSTTTLNGTTIPASKTLVVTTDKLSALAATTSAELAGVISDETGSGSLVFANSPTLVTPALGTPSALVGTNITGTAAAFNINGTVGATTPSTVAATSVTALSNSGYQAVVGQLTSGDRVGISGQASGSGTALVFFDNAQTTFRPAIFDASSHSLKISGVEKASVTSTGLQGAIGASSPAAGAFTTVSATTPIAVASGGTGVSTSTGTTNVVLSNSPTLVTPILGTPQSGTLTSCTGLPISTGVSGLGTGVATALAVNVGSAGAPVLFNGALGTPASGTVTNLTGTASININGTVGATTASTGAFTTATASVKLGAGISTPGTVLHVLSGTNNNIADDVSEGRIIGANKALTGEQANLVIQSNDAMAADMGGSIAFGGRAITASTNGNNFAHIAGRKANGTTGNYEGYLVFGVSDAASDISEKMRLTSTGLNSTAIGATTASTGAFTTLSATGNAGIGTSSPDVFSRGYGRILGITSASNSAIEINSATGSGAYIDLGVNGSRTGSIYSDISSTEISTVGASRPITLSPSGSVIATVSSTGLQVTGALSSTTGANFATSSGNVGIGTTSPLCKTEVYDSAVLGAFVPATRSTWRVLQVKNYQRTNSGSAAGISFQGDNSNGDTGSAGIVGISTNTTGGVMDLAFLTAEGNASVERMRILASGNVGIGTTSPAVRLHVNGGSGVIVSDSSLTASQVVIGVSTLTSGRPFIGTNTNTNPLEIGTRDAQALIFVTNSTERARIDSSGNVGIGVTAPGDKLEIGGSGAGIILASANGTRYRVTVTNLGVLNVAAV